MGVSFADALHGWAVGMNGVILATTDGGVTWTVQNWGAAAWLYDVAFPDASRGWAVGSDGTIIATSDGGATWTAQDSGTTEYLTVSSSPTPATAGW